jgi:lipoprotein-anchoring transpeptidase ErfK/SrfK
VAVTAAGVAYAVTQSGPGKSTSSRGGSSAVPVGHIHFTSITPGDRTRNVDGAYPITISFSAPVAADSPKPLIKPQVPGSWSTQGNSLVFTPATPFGPSTRVTVDVPAGIRSATGALLSTPMAAHFTTSGYSQLALAEMLTDQGYLPMTFAPAYSGAARTSASITEFAPASLTAAGVAYDPPQGTFTFDSGYPSMLQSMWNPNQANVLLRGAVMAFESEHNMTVNASLTPQFWRALIQAQESGEQNQNGYTYAVANKGSPETLTIYHDGHFAMRSLTNTGIPSDPTVDGTFPVYAKYRFTIMSGTNPGGSHYSDPVQWVSYFNGGDAVHYFARPGYGYQQSLGCVELPYNDAVRAYPYLTYGSLVTVTG